MPKPLLLFVYPEVPDTYWSYKHALSFVGKKALMPPLGLATVAAMVPESYECRIVDLNVERLSRRLLSRAELVLISAMIVQADSMDRLIARCRGAGVPVAVGGPHATSSHDEIEGVDYFILGEAEEVFPRFLADFATGTAAPLYRCEGRPDLSAVPIPRFDLLTLARYDSVPIQFSRGCPFDCEFCDIVHLFGRKPRTKPVDRFMDEVDAIYATGFRGSLFVVDDNFIGNRRAVKELLRALADWQRERGYPFALSTEASVDLAADRGLLQLMVDAGFSMVFVGIETPDAGALSEAGKLQNLRNDVEASVRLIQEHGIEVTGGFIIGFDSDPDEIFDLQIDYIRRLAIPTAMVGLLMALPNTRLHDRLSKEGRIVGRANGNNTHEAVLNFRTRMPREHIQREYTRVLSTIYAPREYFARCLALLERYPAADDSMKRERPIKLREVTGFLSSVGRQLFSRYGVSYLVYLVRALSRRRDLIVRIVTMAIQGHHYFTITRGLLKRQLRDERRQWRAIVRGRVRGRMSTLVPAATAAAKSAAGAAARVATGSAAGAVEAAAGATAGPTGWEGV